MKRLSEFYNETTYQRSEPLSAIEGKEVTILGFRLTTGKFGPMAIMHVRTENREVIKVRTGAKTIIDALTKASASDAFPVMAKFSHDGNRWKIE